MDKKVIVTFTRTGQPTVTTEGFVGEACLKASAPIERALTEGSGIDRSYSPEFYQQEGQSIEQTVSW